MNCVRCGRAVVEGHAFCGWCGERLASDSTQLQQQAHRTEGTSPERPPQPAAPVRTSSGGDLPKLASSHQPRAKETAAVLGLASLAIVGISVLFRNTSTPAPVTLTGPQPSESTVSISPVPRYEVPLVPHYESPSLVYVPPPVYVPMKVPEMPRFTPPPMPQYSNWQPMPMQPTLQPLPQLVIPYSPPVMQMRRIEPVPSTPTKQTLTDVIQQLEQPKASGREK